MKYNNFSTPKQLLYLADNEDNSISTEVELASNQSFASRLRIIFRSI